MIISKDLEIHQTPHDTFFAIKNLRQTSKKVKKGVQITYKADVAGDTEAATKYLERLTFTLLGGFKTYGVRVIKDD